MILVLGLLAYVGIGAGVAYFRTDDETSDADYVLHACIWPGLVVVALLFWIFETSWQLVARRRR